MASEINLMIASNIIDFSKWIFYIKKFLWVEEKQDGPKRAIHVFPNFLFMATTQTKRPLQGADQGGRQTCDRRFRPLSFL